MDSSDSNTVTLRDDYIEVIWYGSQTVEKVRQSNVEVLAAAEKLRAQSKPILLLLCINNHPAMPNMGAFREVVKIFRAFEFDRMAISGAIPPRIMTLVTTVVSTFNRQLDINYFKEADQALAWLKSYPD